MYCVQRVKMFIYSKQIYREVVLIFTDKIHILQRLNRVLSLFNIYNFLTVPHYVTNHLILCFYIKS